jgi:Alphaherpesvirus glycoprotein E
MRFTIKGFSLPVAMLVAGCLVAGCGSSAKSAIGSATSRAASAVSSAAGAATATPTPTVTPTPTPTPTPTTPTAEPSTETVTATETATAAPTESATSPTPTTSTSAAASGSSSGTSLLWLWILLGVLILAGLIAWIVQSGRRRSAATAGWRSRLIDAYAKGSALHDAMVVAEAQGDLASSDARARWYDIQRRADDLAQTLYALREAAPDPEDQAAMGEVLASLQAVRSAMDAERAPGGARPELAEVVRRRLYAFESSLRALRADDEQYP